MLAFWIYLGVAGAGLLGLPSYGAYWMASRKKLKYSGEIVKTSDVDDSIPHYEKLEDIDWWKVNPDGDGAYSHWDTAPPYPATLALLIAGWPVWLSWKILAKSYHYSSKILAIPGKLMVDGIAARRERDKFIEQGKQEVEKILTTSK